MLSRIANGLFWMGRYAERAEHTARYVRVQYYSALDAPTVHEKKGSFMSILKMTGLLVTYPHKELTEKEVLYHVCLDHNNPISIASAINFSRENARGSRDTLSTELWESLNRYYHALNNFPKEKLIGEGLFDFTYNVLDFASIIKGCIDNTLTRNEAWHFIRMGMHIERILQITRILEVKLQEISELAPTEFNNTVRLFQWSTLLKCAESFDMSKRYYRHMPTRNEVLEFLILNQDFPKSICYNLAVVNQHIETISVAKKPQKNSVEFDLAKMTEQFKYLTIDEIAEDAPTFLKNTYNKMVDIAGRIEQQYMQY